MYFFYLFIDGEYLFTDPESKLSKYGPKSWRSSHTHVSIPEIFILLNADKNFIKYVFVYLQGLDANGKPLLELHFRVQFYVESPLMLRDEISRHNYYLQLKCNAASRTIKDCNDQTLLLLGGLALQADSGDCLDEPDTDYIRTEEYLTPHLRTSWGVGALNSSHRENRGMNKSDAEKHYLREACNPPLNEHLNAHVYRMRSAKNETGTGSVQLCIYAKGVKVIADNQPATSFLWPNIQQLRFDRKKFELRSGEHKITLYSANDDKNKMLLALCRETHQFLRKVAPRVKEAIKREEEETNCMHECYLYSRALNLPYASKSDQRISVISSTSSNTTSGIVSDRVHSEDELEILINGGASSASGIGAPSTESLALAHLLDGPSISRQTSSVGQVSLKELEDTFAALTTRQKNRSSSISEETEKDRKDTNEVESSPSSAHNIGSQCSSTCSTIVVATDTITLPPLGNRDDKNGRRHSTSSSLELGFSHTTQNSTVSEINNSFSKSYTDEMNDNDDSQLYAPTNPAPTETSGVYTMNSSEMTGQSSEIAESESHESSHYGIFAPKSDLTALDSVDGDFRPRSDSSATSSSFRGDGSDPADAKHTLLSAEELTDLIVGRGTYPCRKSVSTTLDSDSDYVTLPLPMEGESYIQGSEDTAPTEEEYEEELLNITPPAPPKRIDSDPNRSLSSIVENHRCSPPPYNAHHETTGLRGPDIPSRVPVSYEQQPPPPRPPPLVPTPVTEEVPARFITTKPQISILKAHTSLVNDSARPSYAAPTPSNMSLTTAASTIGIPIMPYNINTPAHKSMSIMSTYLEPKAAPQPRTCVLLPIIKQRRRQPPPPPAAQLATVYASQLARSQIELYQQQLYSDVDYVIYPLQDPAISQQEYLDAKQGSILAAMAAQSPQPPPYLAYHTVRAHNRSWDACKNHALYRSTPYLSMATLSSPSRYASTQNLSDTYVQLPSAYSPIYSPSMTSLCSYDVPPPPPLRPRPMPNPHMYSRSKSDENLLNGDVPRPRRLPPPPPLYSSNQRRTINKPPLPAPDEIPPAG